MREHDNSTPKLAYTIKQAEAISGLGRTTLYALFQTGTLTKVKIGARTLIRHADLEALLDRHTVSPTVN